MGGKLLADRNTPKGRKGRWLGAILWGPGLGLAITFHQHRDGRVQGNKNREHQETDQADLNVDTLLDYSKRIII
jgi:hypothetical protein